MLIAIILLSNFAFALEEVKSEELKCLERIAGSLERIEKTTEKQHRMMQDWEQGLYEALRAMHKISKNTTKGE